MTMNENLSLEGLTFQATTKIDINNNVLTITLNRPEKECFKQCYVKRNLLRTQLCKAREGY